MYAQAEKSKENKSRAVANKKIQKLPGSTFQDNRPTTVAQMETLNKIGCFSALEVVQKKSHSKDCNCKGYMVGLEHGKNETNIEMGVSQLVKCTCGKKPHRSDCPRNPKRLKAKAKKKKIVHQESQSVYNLFSYDGVWAKNNRITAKMVKDFVKSYKFKKINGHATSRADTDAKRHANTSRDINAFHGWYNQNKDNY